MRDRCSVRAAPQEGSKPSLLAAGLGVSGFGLVSCVSGQMRQPGGTSKRSFGARFVGPSRGLSACARAQAAARPAGAGDCPRESQPLGEEAPCARVFRVILTESWLAAYPAGCGQSVRKVAAADRGRSELIVKNWLGTELLGAQEAPSGEDL
ncbi:unnamed protein product [Rangifer tarandus platyrhynchus]|uniref:Uncharacterized protein n=2 Tax=Rangifer tarandus platyrhynchus TaxID=3082113 RepID=A0ABN8YGZ7_RANTA|nr:unnamed protein product [Rangifer tarandus platyrhynchus]CAI9698323.1 unnamed protein product [Rangifer tarandus platyrhynchus]